MQYVPSYYGYPNGNQQQPVTSQSLHMAPPPHHQAYAQPTQQQGIPTYPMGLPQTQSPHHQQHHPVLSQSATNDFNMLTKPKRKQVKNACVNCQKACKKCDDGRPCQRCIKYGLTETCTNSIRKERKKGVKRGPYKRRNQANAESSNSSAGGAIRGQTNNHTNANVNTNNTNLNTTTTMSSPYGNYPSYESYPSTNPNVTYTNPMQQYVLAIQQQQALYNNLPYQQPMNTSSTPSTPLATTPTPTTVPSPLSHSTTTTTPNTNNTNTNNNSNHNNNPNDHHSPSSITHEQKDTTHHHHHHLQQQSSSSSSNNESSQKLKIENDEEGSKKLNVLSQLCSDVLDRSPEQKPAIINHNNNNMETNTNVNNNNNNNIQRPILSTPISSTPSSANASPILYKQEIQHMVYPNQHQQQHQHHQQQQQQQPHHLSQNNWQPHW
ncbi:unnamed protein product [Cunninghamella echinulata]